MNATCTEFLKALAALVVATVASGSMAAAELNAPERPNILMIVVDDMGYGDVSAHGHPWFKTPNFDRLYQQSVRMTDFMVSPTCAPTRAALMTGAHEFHSGVTHTILGMEQMNEARTTVANVLSAAGYDTGMFGKWHLGDTGSHVPWRRGFRVGVGVNEKRVDFFAEVLQTDWILGRLLDFLEEKGLVKNTLVFVMNDNGGTCGVDAFNAAMRGDKGTAWLGGTRAYAFWRLPGVLEPRDVTESCAHIDILPTLAEVAGASIGNLQDQVEGRSAWGLLTGKDSTWPERNLYAHVARWSPGQRDAHQYEGAMVRRGNYDLVRVKTAIGRDGYSDHPGFHRAATPRGDWALYDRKADSAEEHNLADRYPELVQRLSADFERWWADSRKYLIHENDTSGTKNVPK